MTGQINERPAKDIFGWYYNHMRNRHRDSNIAINNG